MKKRLGLKKYSNSKYGFILAELMVYMALSIIVLYVATMMLFLVLKVKRDNSYDEVKVAQSRIIFLNIDKSLNLWSGTEKKVTVSENRLTIEYPSGQESYSYYFSNNYIQLNYIKNSVSTSFELGKGVKDLKFYKKENLIYVDLKINSKEEEKRCFVINQ